MAVEKLDKTPLHAEHVALGARLVPFAGYEMPVQYEGVKAEHLAVRSAAGLFDVCHMGELELTGPTAGKVVDGLITNDASTLTPGQALYTCACNEQGTILDDLIVYRLEEERWLVVCNASNRSKMAPHFEAAAAAGGAGFADRSDATALIALQGPKALPIAAAGGGEALADLASFHLMDTELFGVAVTAARTGYTGEDGVELFCDAERAADLWRGILAAGGDEGLVAAGLGARDTLRLEARLSLYGNDIDETTHPFEAGLGWTVKLNKATPFVGQEALRAIKEKGNERRLVGFEMRGRGIARQGYPILAADGEAELGVVTSGSPSPTLGTAIGLGYVAKGHTKVGTEIIVDCRGRKVAAEIVKTPFYKRA